MRKDGKPRPKASYHGPERSTESNHEAGSFAASVNNRPGGPGDGDLAGRCPDRAGQGLVRYQLGARGRARRLFPRRGRRHLSEIRPRRHHRARRSERQQPHAADRGQARLLHGREHADVVRCGGQQRAGGDGRRRLPEGSAGLPHPSGIQGDKTRRAEAADSVCFQGRNFKLFSVAEIRIWIQRGEGQALYLQPAAVHRRQAKRDAGLCHLGAVRDRESRKIQARHHPAGGLWFQHLLDLDRNPPRTHRQEARSGSALRRRLDDRLVPLFVRRQCAGQRADQEAQSGNDRRIAGLFAGPDEGIRHCGFRRHLARRHRRHDRRARGELLRQNGARRRGQARHRFPQGLHASLRQQGRRRRPAAEELGRHAVAKPAALPEMDSGAPGLAVSLRAVTKVYDSGVMALGPLDLDVAKGEFVSLLGPSGCGKSTALRLIAGLSAPTSGTVGISRSAGEPRGKHAIGFVFQEPTLMPWTSVRDNVRLPLKLAHAASGEANSRVEEALTQVGLADFADAYPRELSGGMKMRVSLARALVTDPDILLMDEPFAALDEITRFRLNNDLLALWRSLRKTIVFVTHSVFESVYLSQRVVVMTSRPGRIATEISIEA